MIDGKKPQNSCSIELSGYAKNRFHVIRPPTAILTTSKVELLCLYVRALFLCRILINYIHFFLDMVGMKHCSWGRCNMDSRYPDRMPKSLKELQEMDQKVFIPFIKPWHNPERCKKWVNACSRKNFTTKSITKNSYICALHWPKQKGPIEEFPDPLKATLTTEEMEKTSYKRKALKRQEFESTSNGRKAKTLSHQGKIQSSLFDLDDIPEIVEDMNEEIMTGNDKATQTDISNYVLDGQISNRIEPILLCNQMNVSSEHVRTLSNLSYEVICRDPQLMKHIGLTSSKFDILYTFSNKVCYLSSITFWDFQKNNRVTKQKNATGRLSKWSEREKLYIQT